MATIQQLLGGQSGAPQQNVSAIQQLLGGQAGVGAAQQNVGQTPQQESLYQALNQNPLSGQMSQLDMLAAIQQQQQHLAILNAVGGAKGGAAGGAAQRFGRSGRRRREHNVGRGDAARGDEGEHDVSPR